MKHLHLDVEAAGFYGAYWPCTGGSDCVVIAMIGDDPEAVSYTHLVFLCLFLDAYVTAFLF